MSSYNNNMAFADLDSTFASMMENGDTRYLSVSDVLQEKNLPREVALDIEAMKDYFDKVETTKAVLNNLHDLMYNIETNDYVMYDDEFVLFGTMIEQLVDSKELIHQPWFKKHQFYLVEEFPIKIKKALSKYAEEAIMTMGYLCDREVKVIYDANTQIIQRIHELGFGYLNLV